MSTAIQWTDITDNIIVAKEGGWWCKKISPGCAECYAEKLNQSSFFGGNKRRYNGEPPEMVLRMDLIEGWQRMLKPKRHFVASMTDVFGDWVTQDMVNKFLDGMRAAPMQTFQVLTKRVDVALERVTTWLELNNLTELPGNIQIGASVENQAMADLRIKQLLEIPARVRFLSVEPMLEEIDFKFNFNNTLHDTIGEHIHWVIFGGESGSKARPCNVDWIIKGIVSCRASKIPCFVKQLGEKACWPLQIGDILSDVLPPMKDKKRGEISEWPKPLQVREFPV